MSTQSSSFSPTQIDLSSEDETLMVNSSPSKSPWRAPYKPFTFQQPALNSQTHNRHLSVDSNKQPGPGGVGLSDPILSELRRKKLDIVNRLHSIGSQRDIDLPSLVVIGSQSAGKSSLIESISGITLPRSSGTCTRCPTECRLIRTSDSEPWQCAVSLRFFTDEHGRALDRARNIQFGSVMKNPKDVEDRLRRAQLAILNPSINSQVFLDGNYPLEQKSLNFSNNTVCLEIKGPEVTDLSFCDLPGLIASVADGGRDEDVEEVRELVSTYIQNPSSIILLTVACEVDFETQGAYRLAKKYDPEGVRTIGVLTKPDRIPDGEHAQWFKLIRNESSPLKNGWYCVKQLSSAEIEKGYSFEEARRHCEIFFKKDPWANLDAVSKKRLGTRAVTAKLNDFLMNVISKRIPEISQELQTRIQKTREELQNLPTPPSSDPVFEIMRLVSEFSDNVYNNCQGIHLQNGTQMVQSALESENHFERIHKEQKKFKDIISSTAPQFKPFPRNTPVPLVEMEKTQFTFPNVQDKKPIDTSPTDKIMYLDDISDSITRAITRELPDFSPFHVVQNLINQFTEMWKDPAFNLVNDLFHIIMEHHMRLVRRHFEKHTEGGLYHAVRNLLHGYMQSRKENVEKQLKWMLKLESFAFTLNDSMFLKHKQERLEAHREMFQTYKVQGENASALTVMATVEAYFEVAHRRFVDNIPLAIDHELVRVDKRSLQEILCKGLKLTDPHASEICARLLAEPAHIADLREEITGRLERFSAAQMELMDI